MTTSDSSMTTDSVLSGLDEGQIEAIRQADELFDKACAEKYQVGKQNYGAFAFIENPTLQMAMDEIVDLANYARFTFIKLALLKHQIDKAQAQMVEESPSGF